LAADRDNIIHHGLWNVVAIFPAGLFAGTRTLAGTVLADPAADVAQLRNPDANYQSLVAAEEVDLAADRSSCRLTLASPAWGFVNFGVLRWLPASLIAEGRSVGLTSALIARSALIAVPTVAVCEVPL
jgi:hypothetical protein